jgi:hypothetical protein
MLQQPTNDIVVDLDRGPRIALGTGSGQTPALPMAASHNFHAPVMPDIIQRLFPQIAVVVHISRLGIESHTTANHVPGLHNANTGKRIQTDLPMLRSRLGSLDGSAKHLCKRIFVCPDTNQIGPAMFSNQGNQSSNTLLMIKQSAYNL